MNKVVVGNWKMFPTLSDSLVLATALKKGLEDVSGVEIVLAPPLSWLVSVRESWKHKSPHLHFAAQNIWPEDQGAFTGETSVYLLKDIVEYAIVGHSERRKYGREDNDLIQEKIQACLKWRIIPVICVGEEKRIIHGDGTIDSYQWGKLAEQLMAALEGISRDKLGGIIIAYEPVWAIGTNNPATPAYALKLIDRLRARVAEKYGDLPSRELRFIYGGSVNGSNCADYLRHPEIAGLLPGSASVKAQEFIAICQQASHLRG